MAYCGFPQSIEIVAAFQYWDDFAIRAFLGKIKNDSGQGGEVVVVQTKLS